VTAQNTTRIIKCYRIGDPHGKYPIFDATGSTINPGRWNTTACAVIYTARYYSTALLEKLVHGSGSIPKNQHYIEVTLPDNLTYEVFNIHDPASRGWDDQLPNVSQIYGDSWYNQQRSLLLFVPSVVARFDENILINPKHLQFHQIQARGSVSNHTPVTWDSRLYGSSIAP
jgi:RES domain-containing protein